MSYVSKDRHSPSSDAPPADSCRFLHFLPRHFLHFLFLVFPAILFVQGSRKIRFPDNRTHLEYCTIGKTRYNGMHNEPDPAHINLTLDLDPSNSQHEMPRILIRSENVMRAISSKLAEKGDKNIISLIILTLSIPSKAFLHSRFVVGHSFWRRCAWSRERTLSAADGLQRAEWMQYYCCNYGRWGREGVRMFGVLCCAGSMVSRNEADNSRILVSKTMHSNMMIIIREGRTSATWSDWEVFPFKIKGNLSIQTFDSGASI